jgi:Mce-associated membrane protein
VDGARQAETTDEAADIGDDAVAENADDAGDHAPSVAHRNRRIAWARVLAFGVLPALALVLALAAGYLKWQDSTLRGAQLARIESVQAASGTTTAILSYHAATVGAELRGARDRLTGDFKNTYTSLTQNVVIPGAQQKQISSVATVPGAASVSASERHAVVVVFVDQTVTIGNGPPSSTASAVRVTLDKTNDRWLVSQFEPI